MKVSYQSIAFFNKLLEYVQNCKLDDIENRSENDYILFFIKVKNDKNEEQDITITVENNKESNIEEIDIQYNFEDKKDNHEDKYNNLDISALISNKPTSSNEKNLNIDDFDPLFPDTDFDSLTDFSKSKYDDLDFSALISKKTK